MATPYAVHICAENTQTGQCEKLDKNMMLELEKMWLQAIVKK
jgi:hypothetical protein